MSIPHPNPIGHAFHIYGSEEVLIGFAHGKYRFTDAATIKFYKDIHYKLAGSASFGEGAKSIIRKAINKL